MDQGQIRFHPFDPDSALIPEIAEFGPLKERSGGSGVILIASPEVETRFWCAQAAAALVSGWSAKGARILLADVSLVRPVLHEIFHLPNSQGITDVMMGGAQLRTVGHRVGSPRFLFISAGSSTADSEQVMRSGQWDVVIEALGKVDLDLVMYAPADLPGLDILLARSSGVLLLGGNQAVAPEGIERLGLSEAPRLGQAEPEGTPAGVVPLPTNRGVERASGGSRSAIRWKVAIAVGLLALAGWAGARFWLGGAAEPLDQALESTEAVDAVDATEAAEERAEASVVAAPPETVQAYSLSLAAYQDVTVAVRLAEGLAVRRADVLFTTVPVEVSDRIFYRILAGPAADPAAAEELRNSLGETLGNENPATWILRATPVAFFLGDYELREMAYRRAAEAPLAWLAPYVFEVGATDQPTFRVYAGAYADSTEASVVYERFTESGEEPLQLVTRVGRYAERP